jgi:hypothetical protein
MRVAYVFCVSMCECITNHTEVAGRLYIGVLSHRDSFRDREIGGLCDVNVFMVVFHKGA